MRGSDLTDRTRTVRGQTDSRGPVRQTVGIWFDLLVE
jgi:hypothetical protein